MSTNLRDYIDLEKVSELLEGFNKSTGFVTALLDLEGNVLSKSGWRQICTEFHRIHPTTSERCTYSDTILAGKMKEGEKCHSYTCLNGLTDIAAPLVINGKHVGNLFSGQFFLEKPNADFFKNQAKEFGFDEKKYMEAFREVPVISEDKVTAVMEFLIQMTNLICDLGVKKAEQDELNKRLRAREIELKYQLEVEKLTNLVSITIANAVNENIDEAINSSLEELARFAGSNRSTLFSFSADTKFITNTHEWCLDPSDSQINFLQNIPFESFGWHRDQLLNKGKSIISKISDYPPEAKNELEWVKEHGHRSLLFITLYVREKPVGAIGFYGPIGEEVDWPDQFINMLYTVGNVFLSAIERSRTEDKLKESEERYRSLIEVTTSIVWTTDETGGFVTPQASWEKFTGQPWSEQKGFGWTKKIHPDDTEHILKAWNKACEEMSLYETYGRIWNQNLEEWREFEVKATPLINHDGTLREWVGVITDVTERKKAEQELIVAKEKAEESERYSSMLVSSTPIGLALAKLSGELVEVNEAYANIIGYSIEETLKLSYWDITPERFTALEQEQLNSLKTKGVYGPYEKEYIHKTGVLIPVRLQGKIIEKNGGQYIWSSVEDISDIKNAEEKLANKYMELQASEEELRASSEELYSTTDALKENLEELKKAKEKAEEAELNFSHLFNRTRDGYVINKGTGEIVSSNPAYLKMLGYDNQEEINWKKITPEKWLKWELETHGEILVKRGYTDLYEKEYIRKDGTVFPIQIQAFLLNKSEKLEDAHMACFVRDITTQKAYERELADYQNFLSASQKIGKIGSYKTDLKSNTWKVSNEMYDVLGIDETFPNTVDSFMMLIHPDSLEEFGKYFEKVLEQYSDFNYEYKIIRPKDKVVRWVHGIGKFEFDEDGNPCYQIGTIQDITDRKQIEQDLLIAKERAEANEKRLVYAQQLAELGFWDWNIETGELYWSDYTFIHYGFKPQEFVPNFKIFNKIVHPDDLAYVVENVNNAINNNAEYSIKFRFIRPNGEVRYLYTKGEVTRDNAGRAISFLGSQIDITEMLLSEQELMKAKEKVEEHELLLRLSTELGNIAVWQYNFTENNMLRSQNHDALYGLEWQEKWDISVFLNVTHPDDREYSNTIIQQAVSKGGSDRYSFDFRVITPEGDIKWLSVIGQVVERNNDGIGIIVRGCLIDITERKNNEIALKKNNDKIAQQNDKLALLNHELSIAKDKAEESNRLKSAFLANMSHEIRTPMNGILGFTGLLKNPKLTGDTTEEYIKIIEKSGKRMLNTINDIIDISKIESGQVKVEEAEVSVNEILEEQYNFFSQQATSKGLKFNYIPSLTDRESRIVTDSHKLEGILINLIKNAIKYTETGEITFGCSIKDKSDSKFIEFYVKDTGMGVPANREEAIFNRFEQADVADTQVFEGSGLGLAISKSYVEMLGGEIGVNANESSGSTFTFSIPYKQQNMEVNNAVQDERDAGVSMKDLSVIVAEDDEVSRIFLETILEDRVRSIIYTVSGKETVEKIRENPDVDIILMDIKMRDMNGYAATQEIRKFNSDVIIIAQTAYSFKGDRVKALEAGCNDYISKPIEVELLRKIINKHLKQS